METVFDLGWADTATAESRHFQGLLTDPEVGIGAEMAIDLGWAETATAESRLFQGLETGPAMGIGVEAAPDLDGVETVTAASVAVASATSCRRGTTITTPVPDWGTVDLLEETDLGATVTTTGLETATTSSTSTTTTTITS